MDKINRIKELVELLNKASDAYYVNDNPIMSDKEYDKLYDELEVLEKETGYILSASVTQRYKARCWTAFKRWFILNQCCLQQKLKTPTRLRGL